MLLLRARRLGVWETFYFPGEMMSNIKSICVFCGSSIGARPEYGAAAREMGHILARKGIGLVYGGGRRGLMGEIADAALASGGKVIGVIPRQLELLELAHRGVTELRVVESMHERKALMEDLSDAFIGLPGGLGTMEEFFEIATWSQLGIHSKPLGLLNVCGYYDLVDQLLAMSVQERFLQEAHRAEILIYENASDLLTALISHRPSGITKASLAPENR